MCQESSILLQRVYEVLGNAAKPNREAYASCPPAPSPRPVKRPPCQGREAPGFCETMWSPYAGHPAQARWVNVITTITMIPLRITTMEICIKRL